MQDYEYELMKIKAAIVPQAETWPSPDVEVSIMGDRPRIKGGALHWTALHSAVTTARDRVTKVFAEIAAVESDKSLSAEGKTEQKQAIAKAAIASLEKSKSLAQAQSSVEHQVARWDEDLGLMPKAPESISDAMICAETRAHLAAMRAGERMAFIEANIAEVSVAVLTAPSFLSGLTPAELGVVKQRIEARANPEIAR